jgi:ankyrin repeat protein
MKVVKKMILTAFLIGSLAPTMPLRAAALPSEAPKEQVFIKNANYDRALFDAAQAGHLIIVQALLATKVNPNVANIAGCTALMIATARGHTETVRALIQAGASLDERTQHGLTSLMLAIENGHTEIVQALLDAKVNPDVANTRGDTALIRAAELGQIEIVQALIQARASLDLVDSEHGGTALMYAALTGNIKIAKALIAAHASLNIPSNYGSTAFIIAALKEHDKLVQELINAGANLDAQNFYNNDTALITTVRKGKNIEIVQALLDAGADLSLRALNQEKTDRYTAHEFAQQLNKTDMYNAIEQEIEKRNKEHIKREARDIYTRESGQYLVNGPLSISPLCQLFADYAAQPSDGTTSLHPDPKVEDRKLFEDEKQRERIQHMQEQTAQHIAMEDCKSDEPELSAQSREQ